MAEYQIKFFDSIDEACNLGNTRIGNDLYESTPLFNVEKQSTEEITHISSFVSQNTLYLAIDRNFWVFSNFSESTPGYSNKFSFAIDTFKLIANLLLIGLNNGDIYLVDTLQNKILTNCTLCENVWFGSKYFIGIYEEEAEVPTFLVLTKKGQFYRVQVDALANTLNHELIVEFNHNITIASFTNNYLVAIGNKLMVYDMVDKVEDDLKLENNVQFKNIWPVNKFSCIAQRNDGSLWWISFPNSLCMEELKMNETFDDVVFYYYAKKSYIYYVAEEMKSIKMMEFNEDNTEIFNLNIDNFQQLVYTNDEDESQLYLTKELNRIWVHRIQESQPEDRLKRLIKKTLFDEAEAFAKKYNLSRLEINKAKVTNYVDKIFCSDNDIDELLQLMASISDDAFNVLTCQNIVSNCETINGVEKVIRFWTSLNCNDMPDKRAAELILNATVSSLNTIKTLSRCQGEEVTVASWQRLHKSDLFEYLITLLRYGELEAAIVIFSRLEHSFFTLENIHTVLAHLSHYDLDQYTSFLYTMIPTTLLNLLGALEIFVDTIKDKVHKMELQRREIEFPEKAITFVDEMLQMIHCEDIQDEQDVQMSDDVDARQALQSLMNISMCLNTILELKNNFSIYLPLKDCLDGPGAMLRALLRFNIGVLDKFLKNFLVKFMLRNNIDADEVLSAEIGLMQSSKHDYWSTEIPQIWASISSTSKRLELLLGMLRAAPKPWSAGVRRMLDEAVKFNHPKVSEIKKELQNEDKYIVLYRPEYQLRTITNPMEIEMFVIQRIIYCNLPTLFEDVYTLCTKPDDKQLADVLLMLHFIEINDTCAIYKLIHRFTADEASGYIIDLCQCYSNKLVFVDNNIRRALLKTLEYLQAKATPRPSHDSCINMHRIIDVLPPEMRCLALFKKLLQKAGRQEILDAIIREMSLATDDFPELLIDAKKYARAFGKNYEYILWQVCQLVKNPQLTYKTAQVIDENSSDIETMCSFTVFVLLTIGTQNDDMYGTFFNNTISTDDGDIVLDEGLLKKTLLLARSIIAKAILLTNGEPQVMTVAKWVFIYNNLISDAPTDCIQNGSGSEAGKSTLCTLSAVCQTFTKQCCYYRSKMNSASKYLHYRYLCVSLGGDDDDEEYAMPLESHCNLVVQQLAKALPSIQREGQHWTVQQLLVTMQGSMLLCNNRIAYDSLQQLALKVKRNMLTDMFAARVVNAELAFFLLMSYPRKKALKVINEAMCVYRDNFTKFETIVRLGVRLTTLYQSTDHYRLYILGIKWRKTLVNCTLPMKEFFIMASKNELLACLITQHEISVEQITEFCEDFKLDAQVYYLKYLQDLIATWKPSYEVTVNAFGERSAVVADDGDLEAMCRQVVALITDCDAVLNCINNLWNTLNFYYYEAFLAILSVAAAVDDVRYLDFRGVLHFLMRYRRISKPTDLETEQWFTRMAHAYQPLDVISEWRFPFCPELVTPDLWKLLRSEIKLSNYLSWFDNVNMLKYLNRDEICSYVVKDFNFVFDYTDTSYKLLPMFEDVFVLLDACLAHISDKVVAASMAFHLLSKTADGADRVIAAQMAYKYAKICKESGVEDATYKQVEKRYFTYTSKHILHVYNLATDEYLNLLGDPNGLINALYRDERILKGPNVSLSQCPDINKASDELAALYQIDIRAKRIELLTNLLNDNPFLSGPADESIFLSPEMNYTGDVNTDCVLRAAYICVSGDPADWVEHLHKMFEESEQPLIQGRLLKTMCMINPPDEISQRYDCSYSDIKLTIDNFFVINDLHSLGIKLDLEKYSSLDKHRLLYKLGKNLTDPLHVKVMVAICKRFCIYDLNVWEKITYGMIELNMINDLKKCLLLFVKLSILISKDIYCKAWQAVIDSSTKSLSTSNDIDKDLVKLIHLIQVSPILNQLNLRITYQTCIKLKKFSYALIFLQYDTRERRDEYLKDLISICEKNTLLEEFGKLQNKGFIGFKHVKSFVEEA